MSTPVPRAGLREFWSGLRPEGRWLLSTVAVQTVGRGLTLPFTIIYLHEVRGISLDLAGSLMAFIAVVALVVTGPGGALTDRIGARRMLLAATTAQLVGCVVLAYATTPAAVLVAFALIGFNFGVSWPAFNALVAAVTTGESRTQYFGINFALVNLGIGLGGVVGGFYADVADPTTFTVIFLADGACMLVPIALLLGPLRHLHGRAEQPDDAAGAGAGAASYLSIVRRPAVLWLTALTFLATFVGYGQLEAGFPTFARQVSEVSTEVIGFAFAVNTAVIVGLQFLTLRLIAGRRRTRVLLVMTGLWSAAWVLLGLTGAVPASAAAVVGVLLFHAVFALGETMLQPTIPAITNDLAPDHLRGRYNAVSSGAFQAGTIAGPVIAGLLLDRGWDTGFIGVLVLGCAAMAGLALALERRIESPANGVGPPPSSYPASVLPIGPTDDPGAGYDERG